jgi:hypothetical protein
VRPCIQKRDEEEKKRRGGDGRRKKGRAGEGRKWKEKLSSLHFIVVVLCRLSLLSFL